MRVTSVSLLCNEEEAIRFDLRNVETQSPYLVQEILGLDAEDLITKFYGFGKETKKRFYDFVLKPRDIVIKLGLNPRFHLNEDYSYIRDRLYRAISATRSGLVVLQFHSGAATVAQISGFIKKFEVSYFDKEPKIQLSIRCDDPMFRSINPTIMDVNDISNSNPVVIADSASTSPHGFKLKVTFTATTPEFNINDKAVAPDWTFQVIPLTSFLAGDVLHFSSEFKAKELYLVRDGVTTHLMDRIISPSTWPIVFPGFNSFHFPEIDSFDWNSLEFSSTYWGV